MSPVMVFEHKFLYRCIREEIPDDYCTVEIGKAGTMNKGLDLTIITCGLGVHWAKEYVENHSDLNFRPSHIIAA